MAINLNYDKLRQLAQSGSENGFMEEYHRQWVNAKGDPSIPWWKDAANLYQGYRNKPDKEGLGQIGTRGGNYWTMGNQPIGAEMGNFVLDALKASQRGGGRAEPEFGTLESTLGLLFDRGGIKNFAGMWDQLKTNIEKEVVTYLQEQTYLYETINEKAQMTGELAADFRNELMMASPELIGLGISFGEMADSVATLLQNSGKFKLLNAETIREIGLASKFIGDMKDLAGMGKNFEDVGLGIRDMTRLVEDMGFASLRVGLNARNTITTVNENLAKLNSYGFKNGVEGLTRMAQKSIEFRMNMQDVFNMAEKVWEPDKALELVANLQVIGGAFGDLNDPLKLMYMATNNVEGLQDALIGATKSLVSYNDEQGRFQITGANLRRAKAMADEFGMKLEDLSRLSIAAAERTRAASDMMASGLVMDEKDKEFLTNLAQMKDGRMVIEVPETLRERLGASEVALETMSESQMKEILSRREEFEKITSMEDIARRQVTLIENIQRDLSYVRAMARVSVGAQIGDIAEKLTGVNQQTLSAESKNIRDWLTNKIKTTDDLVSAFVEKIPEAKAAFETQKGTIKAETRSRIYEIPEGKTESKAEKPAETMSYVRHDVVLSSSTALMDPVMRKLTELNYKEVFNEGYLHNPVQK